MVVEVLHPARPNVSKEELSEKLAAIYKSDKERVVPFGFRTQFGGGRSTGFALIYDSEAAQRKFEPRYRLVRVRFSGYCHFEVMINIHRPTCRSKWYKKWTRLLVNFAKSVRTVLRRYVAHHESGFQMFLTFSIFSSVVRLNPRLRKLRRRSKSFLSFGCRVVIMYWCMSTGSRHVSTYAWTRATFSPILVFR